MTAVHLKKLNGLFSVYRLFLFLLAYGWLGNTMFAQSSYKEIEVNDGGTIRGFVKLTNHSSKIAPFEITKDSKYCGKKKTSPRLIIGKNNGVKNSIVCLEGITQGKKFTLSEKPTLNQHHCEYEPHITIVPFGTNLEITNSDPILHNVHAYSAQAQPRSMFNIAQPIKGQRTTVKQRQLDMPGLIAATCDAGHPWMSAYIMITEHPYVSVTDEKGEFQIENIPPGTYKLKMWHEGVSIANQEVENGKVKKYYYEEPYEESKEVTVTANVIVDLDFDLKLR